MNDILTLLLPTNEPETLKRFWLPSIGNIKEIAPIAKIAINFQSPYTQKDIDEIIEEIKSYGFEVVYVLNDKYTIPGPGQVPFNKIRNDTAMLSQNSLFYALTDDDFSYQGTSPTVNKTAGHQYLDIIHYMLTHEKCGFTLFGAASLQSMKLHHVGMVDPYKTFYAVRKGYILRNMSKHNFVIYPDDAIDMKGAGEEKIIAASRLALGYYPAIIKSARTHHYENWKKDGVKNGAQEYNWELQEVLDNNVHKYLNEHYNVKMKRLFDMHICDPKIYYDHGGLDYARDFESTVVDYTDSNVEQLISEIISLASEKR